MTNDFDFVANLELYYKYSFSISYFDRDVISLLTREFGEYETWVIGGDYKKISTSGLRAWTWRSHSNNRQTTFYFDTEIDAVKARLLT